MDKYFIERKVRDIVTGRIIHDPSPLKKEKVSSFELDEYFNCEEDFYE